jgi:antitoxin component YwqK of YwqJK toxin-antitoxin module
MKNGVTITHFGNGEIKSIMEFRNDTLIGTVYYFTETGESLKKNGIYKGKLDFPIKYWKENGNSLYGE